MVKVTVIMVIIPVPMIERDIESSEIFETRIGTGIEIVIGKEDRNEIGAIVEIDLMIGTDVRL